MGEIGQIAHIRHPPPWPHPHSPPSPPGRSLPQVIAGKIIAAIATTTAAVCGLVMMELFKLVQGKGTTAYMNRAIGLAVNSYTSFTQVPLPRLEVLLHPCICSHPGTPTQEEPIKFATYTERVVPTSDELPPDAFDDKVRWPAWKCPCSPVSAHIQAHQRPPAGESLARLEAKYRRAVSSHIQARPHPCPTPTAVTGQRERGLCDEDGQARVPGQALCVGQTHLPGQPHPGAGAPLSRPYLGPYVAHT